MIRQDMISRLEKLPSEFTVDKDSFLGKGSFAKVKRGRFGNQDVAIKIIEIKGRGSSFSASMKKAIENEVLLMSLCSHPCILQIYGYCKVEPHTTHLILELGSIGSLWSVLENIERLPSIPLSLSISWISDILCGLNYLHEQKILHRDIKAENVMLSDDLRCKLTDFGLSKQQLESSFGVQSSSHKSQVGSFCFMAPEVFDRVNGRYSHRSDVYSCGMTCFQILFRQSPFGTTDLSVLDSVISAESWKLFVKGSLAADPTDRLSSWEALDLIETVQRDEHVGGDPRQIDHSKSLEVEMLNQVLVSCRYQETQLNADAVTLSEMVIASFHLLSLDLILFS
jgi:serine/threonine protein kinase